jgi:hypothetical protein
VRHNVTVKKSLRATEQERADVARARRRWIRKQGLVVSKFRDVCPNLKIEVS